MDDASQARASAQQLPQTSARRRWRSAYDAAHDAPAMHALILPIMPPPRLFSPFFRLSIFAIHAAPRRHASHIASYYLPLPADAFLIDAPLISADHFAS